MPRKAYSEGGKEFTVQVNGDSVHMEWVDYPAGQDGDALFTRKEAVKLISMLSEAILKQIQEDEDAASN